MRSLLFGLALSVAMSGAAVHAADSPEAEKMAQQIAKQLKESGQLKNYRVGVKYEDGVAWLLGSVTSPSQKRIAEELASNCAGVDHVVCRLEVTGADAEPAPMEAQPEIQPAAIEQPIADLEPAMPLQRQPQRTQLARGNMPVPYATSGGRGVQQANFANQQAGYCPDGSCMPGMGGGGMMGMGPQQAAPTGAAVSYENPQMPGYAWPTYAASPNYAALTYPKQYSASAWPYIGPFYPYPQVPLGWRKVSLEWDDGWWFLDFSDSHH